MTENNDGVLNHRALIDPSGSMIDYSGSMPQPETSAEEIREAVSKAIRDYAASRPKRPFIVVSDESGSMGREQFEQAFAAIKAAGGVTIKVTD